MAIFIDRSNEINRSAESRKRFIDRVKKSIKSSLQSGGASINHNFTHGAIHIDSTTIEEPAFLFSWEKHPPQQVVIKNYAYNKGDLIIDSITDQLLQQLAGNGQGDGSQEDNFSFLLSDEEFTNILFEGFKLPNFIEKDHAVIDSKKFKHAGFVKYGMPANLNIYRSFAQAFGRRIAVKGAMDERIKEIEKIFEDNAPWVEQLENFTALSEELEELKNRKNHVIWMDESDLRYNVRVPVISKTSEAVVFFLLDVSGSMDQRMKNIAKRFFYMMQLFLKTQYKHVEIVFIRHTEEAKEVDQKDFFYSRETGGTAFTPAYELMHKIQQARYPASRYNIYLAHSSDSDLISQEDYKDFKKLFKSKIHPIIQYGTYIHVGGGERFTYKMESYLEELYTLRSEKFKVVALDEEEHCYELMHILFGGKII